LVCGRLLSKNDVITGEFMILFDMIYIE